MIYGPGLARAASESPVESEEAPSSFPPGCGIAGAPVDVCVGGRGRHGLGKVFYLPPGPRIPPPSLRVSLLDSVTEIAEILRGSAALSALPTPGWGPGAALPSWGQLVCFFWFCCGVLEYADS
jgi:hypothetical protein